MTKSNAVYGDFSELEGGGLSKNKRKTGRTPS